MSNEVILWQSPNGIDLPVRTKDIETLVSFAKRMKQHDIKSVEKAFRADLFDMSLEHVWKRTINLLREQISSFGTEFVAEMLGRPDDPNFSLDSISEPEIINLSTDLGFINDTAQLHFLHLADLINHYSSNGTNEIVDDCLALTNIKNCIKYVLGQEENNFEFKFSDFRQMLITKQLDKESESIELLKESPYFYKRTTVRTLLNLSRTTEGGELEIVLANLKIVLGCLWDGLLSEDKWLIGNSYSEAVATGNKFVASAIKALLLSHKGFDYVPESLRSNTYIRAANNLIRVHGEMNNFHKEPNEARVLQALGKSIPRSALGLCLTASIMCRIGNSWGSSNEAQPYIKNILDKISRDEWTYYFNGVFPGDERVIIKLLDTNPFKKFCKMVQNYCLNELDLKDGKVSMLLQLCFDENMARSQKIADEFRHCIRG